jgi:hypothetical protein
MAVFTLKKRNKKIDQNEQLKQEEENILSPVLLPQSSRNHFIAKATELIYGYNRLHTTSRYTKL